jgi:glycosyltransferase involved in cell wall biosynthesis
MRLNNKFIIIVPLFNVKNQIIECLDSIFNQQFEDLGVIIRDDMSSDGSDEVIKNYLNINENLSKTKYNEKDVIFIRNTEKLYPVGNTYESVLDFVDNDKSIIGVVDGDDKLLKTDAVSKIYQIYQSTNVWMVWSQHQNSNGTIGISKPLPSNQEIYSNRNYWSVTHFRTSLAFLYKKLDKNDIMDPFIPNSYFTYSGDAAFLFPFCEMCGNEKSFFLNEVLYYYNNNLPTNEHNKNINEALKYGHYIRNYQNRYFRLHE